MKPPTRPRLIAQTNRVHLRCCRSQYHSSCHCCRFHCHRCCCRCCSPSHEGTRAQPIRVCKGAAQATRMQPKSTRVQLKPRGHSPSLRGRSPSHKGSARPSLQGRSPSHKGAAPNCEGTAQATRAQPKPRGHSPSHEGSACLNLQGRSPSHSFPHIVEIRLNLLVIVNLLLPLLATWPGQMSCARGSIGRPRPCLDVRPPQCIAVAAATAAVFVLAIATTSNFSPSQCVHC